MFNIINRSVFVCVIGTMGSLAQRVRYCGETQVSMCYATCYSDSSLPILLSVLLTMQQRVIFRGVTLYLIEARDYPN